MCSCRSLKLLLSPKINSNALSLGIDLKRGIKRLAALGSHAFNLHGFTFHKVFILSVRECHTFDFLGDVHTISTQGYNFIGLRIDRDVSRKRLSVLRCYLNGLAKIARSEELLLFFGREL